MPEQKSLGQKIIKPLASLKLAVFVILSMACMTAWGTLVESMYNDAGRARETVYHSWYSYSVFLLLGINLTAVMVDRWPWKKRHLGFLSAHMGILILLLGSLITRTTGIDGSLILKPGETQNLVTTGQTDLIVYSGLATGGTRKIYEQEVHFIKNPPSTTKPHVIHLGSDEIVINGFRPYSIPREKIKASDKKDQGPALRFQISNNKVSLSGWLLTGRSEFEEKDMGPAKIILARKGGYTVPPGEDPILLLESPKNSEELEYSLFGADRSKAEIMKSDRNPRPHSEPYKPVKKGIVKAGESIKTGWMGLEFRLLNFFKSAKRTWVYEPLERATDQSIRSLRFRFRGKDYWMGLNSSVRLFSDEAHHTLIYANRQLKLDFSLLLNEFRMERQQGTQKAASYESDVSVISKNSPQKKTTIAMNSPLEHRGFTFYQSSFKEDGGGQPVLSVLSVNRDPGRFWKYLGSLFIVFGIIHLFYLRSKRTPA